MKAIDLEVKRICEEKLANDAKLSELFKNCYPNTMDTTVKTIGEKDTFVAEQGGKKVAYIIPTAPKGYGGAIKMLTAVSMDGTVMDYTVLEANETPGLGDRGAKSPFKDQFKGKKLENLEVTKSASEKDKIQAMTGATISSRAFTLGVKQAVQKAAELGGK